MIPTITPEQRDAVAEAFGQPVMVIDDSTQKTYFLLEAAQHQEFLREWLRHQMQVGVDDIDAGRVVQWSAEKLKERGRAALRAQGREP